MYISESSIRLFGRDKQPLRSNMFIINCMGMKGHSISNDSYRNKKLFIKSYFFNFDLSIGNNSYLDKSF